MNNIIIYYSKNYTTTKLLLYVVSINIYIYLCILYKNAKK